MRMSARAGTGSTTLALHTSWVTVAAVLLVLAGAAGSRAGAALRVESPRHSEPPEAGHVVQGRSPDAGVAEPAALPVVEEGDCPAICEKLLNCKQGPWKNAADCADACEASNEDAISGRTYRCVAKAKSCGRMKKCTR